MLSLSKEMIFLKETVGGYRRIGAVCASSSALSEEIASVLADLDKNSSRRILEVGAGTGSITRAILEKVGACDRLDICESNVAYSHLLRRLIESRDGRGTINLIVDDVKQHLSGSRERYNWIVSSLPILLMNESEVKRIYNLFVNSLSDRGRLSFYMYLPHEVLRLSKNEVFPNVNRILEELSLSLQKRKTVFRNIPPAWVYLYARSASAA